MSHGRALQFYHSAAWVKTRQAYLESVNYVCERCGKPAKLVHHKTYIDGSNLDDPNVTLNWFNLEALCDTCHALEHRGTSSTVDGLCFDDAGNLIAVPTCGNPNHDRNKQQLKEV